MADVRSAGREVSVLSSQARCQCTVSTGISLMALDNALGVVQCNVSLSVCRRTGRVLVRNDSDTGSVSSGTDVGKQFRSRSGST